MCDPLSKAECVPAFTRESERGPFVREVEKRNERRSEIELLLIVRGHREPGMYIYKSVAESRVTNAHHIIHSVLTGSRSPAGPRRLGTATRISASLSRRLSAFFKSASDQDPKAAKFAVLTPGPGMFVNVRNAPRVVIPPPSETPRVSVCKPLCAILLAKASVYPLSGMKANVGRL